MKNMEASPGPYRFSNDEIISANNSTIAIMVNDGEHTVANQYLLSASRDLLEAADFCIADLETTLDLKDYPSIGAMIHMIDILKAATNRARGM